MEVDKLPSSFTVTRVSRKGRDPFSFGVLSCELDLLLNAIQVLEELIFVCCFLDNKSVIHIPFPDAWGVWCCFKGPGFKVLHVYVCHNGAEWRPHGCTFYLFIVLPLKDKACASQAELQQLGDVPCVHTCSSW